MKKNSRHTPPSARSPLFCAIAFGLIAGTASLHAFAQSVPMSGTFAGDARCDVLSADAEEAARCRAQSGAFDALSSTPSSSAQSAAAPAAYTEQGVIGRPDTWVTDEFKQDWGLGAINAQFAYARGLTGKGMLLGVMDSGVGFNHSEFAGKQNVSIAMVDTLADGTQCTKTRSFGGPAPCFSTRGDEVQIAYVRFNDNVPQNIRDVISNPNANYIKPGLTYESHGTHVAGTIAANRDGSGMHGVAFGANIASARRFHDTIREWARTSTGYSVVDIAAAPAPSLGANTAALNAMAAAGVRAVNHSWGYTIAVYSGADLDQYYNFAGNRPLWDAFATPSLRTGMLQVWAAGNITAAPPPGMRPIAGLTASLPRLMPELEPYWLAVANLTRTGNAANPYAIAGGSMLCGVAKDWCVSAPGSLINSSVMGGDANIQGNVIRNADGSYKLDITGQNPTSAYADYTGTSMATPHVVGALGLLFERYPYLTNPQVRDILLTTATDIGAPGVDEIYGWGLINLQKAIEGYGQFRVNTDVVMNQKAGGTHVWNDARVWDNWTNDIGGPGRLTFNSANGGWLRLSGSNTFNGLTVKGGVLELTGQNKLAGTVAVDGGLLLVSGAGVLENAVTVNAGGTLGGTGTIKGNTTVFGTMAPGASIGTLTVNGNYVQQVGSRFIVEMQPPSATDKLVVNGTATLNGGTVVAQRLPGVFGLGQSYNFLTATGGVNGKFAGVDNSALGTFLQMALRYDATSVYADVIRAAALASVAGTPNQRATSAALDSLPNANTLLQALVLLPTAAQANNAFDQLSGDAHGSLRNVLVDESRHVRNTALTRARTGHDAFTGQSAGPGFSAWASVMSNGGSLDGNANAAQARYHGVQWLVGGDYQFDGGWRIGALGGKANHDANVGLRGTDADIDSQLLGVYGGQRWGGFGVHAGYTVAEHTLDVTRKIAFANVGQSLQSRYDGKTQQAFVEGSYLFGGAQWQVEPYLQYANVIARTHGFTESSGTAALAANAGRSEIGLTTGGVRVNVNLKGAQQEQTWLSLRGGLAYRQASGDLDGANRMQFAGSTGYTVLGAPIAKSATIVDFGIAARTSPRSLLELGYSGQFADEGKDHGATARFSIKF